MVNIRESKDTELHIFTEYFDEEIKYIVYLGDELVGLYYSWEELMARIDDGVESTLTLRAKRIEKGER